MTNSIVTVTVGQQVAPTPSTLQQTGAFISQGATTTAANTSTLISSMADLTAILKGALAITSLTQVAGLATATATAAHGITIGQAIQLTIAGASPAGYNGTFLCTATTSTAFTYAVSSGLTSPATGTIVYTEEDVAELTAMGTTFFAQGSQQAVYVLELGVGSAAQGVTALSTWINNNPGIYYSYLVPRFWAAEATFLTFLASFEATTAKTYFFVTMTTGNYTSFTALMKCVVGEVEAPATPTATEFSAAATFWDTLRYRPSSTNRVTQLAFTYQFGVTPYPLSGNLATLALLKAAGVNVVQTGAEGGIANTIIKWGTTMDVRPFTYWYSVDWAQINGGQALAAAIINGSNDPINPLYYNQNGINRLQSVMAGIMSSAVTFGLAIGTVTQTQLAQSDLITEIEKGTFVDQIVVNAVPFIPYLTANPNDYKNQTYNGLSITYTPQLGFTSITFNLTVSDFVTPTQ